MTPRLSVVLPAFNEAEILPATVAQLLAALRDTPGGFELVVVENGSTDATATIAGELAATHPEVRVESLAVADYGAALRHGLLAARGEVVVNFDVDYYDVGFLDRAVRVVEPDGGPAIVVGSKRAPGAHDERPWPRRFVTAVFSAMLRRGFGLRVSDTHGMKAMRRSAVLPIARRCELTRDLFDTELVLRVERAGLGSAEVPVTVQERRPARTPILHRIPRAFLGLARLAAALRRNPP